MAVVADSGITTGKAVPIKVSGRVGWEFGNTVSNSFHRISGV